MSAGSCRQAAECDAARHPPAHTGMNAQSPHSFQGLSRSNFSRAISRQASCRSSMWPVDMRLLAGESGARVERAVGADGVRVLSCARGTGRCARRRASGKPWRLVSSRRNAILSSSEIAGVAGRCRRPRRPTSCSAVERLARSRSTGISGRMPFGCWLASARTIGLKLTFTSLSANSCSLRNSSSAG